MKILIKNGLVIDPANHVKENFDILIEAGKISKVAKNISAAADKVIDASAKVIIPGLVDMHAHLRQPGREDKETIASATAAALKGGITSLLAMPNTSPAIDSVQAIELLKTLVKKNSLANVLICGAITNGRLGKELSDIVGLAKGGAIAISDDGASVDDEKIFQQALKIAKTEKILTICHCEDKSLSNQGVVNLGIISTKLGLRGISSESEYKRIERDIRLAEKIGAVIHIAHVSCKESVEVIRQAKKRGVRVTCETAPHYFSFTQDSLVDYDTNKKMNPPLRSRQDQEAVKKGLKDGTIDVIASDHAPHTENEKDIEFDRAEFGVVGLETELSAGISELVENKILSLPQLVEKLALNPARILGIAKGAIAPGDDADIAIIDPAKEWLVQKENLVSKSKNSAFLGRRLKGVVEYTIYNGKIAYQA